jgi:D-alanine-D-alanine ligase
VRILIITGGDSSEREVSLSSAKNVEEALIENGHNVKLYDLNQGYDPLNELSKEFDVLFPVLHGEEGEGGKLHKFLDKLGKPIVGTRNYKGMEAGWYKIPFKQYCDENGIPTADWKEVKTENDIIEFGFPSVLKASNGGSSREVVILNSGDDLELETAKELLAMEKNLFVERYLAGIEATVGILNGEALPVVEIVPPEGEWFSYENKYTSRTKEIPFAPSIDQQIQKQIQEISVQVHNNFILGSYSRIDFIISDNAPYALEINTIPGLTSESLLPKAAKAAGLSFNEFIKELVKKAS